MFSVEQKRQISEAVQQALRATGHPELPDGEIQFQLHVDGAAAGSRADIRNNGAVPSPTVNPHNEKMGGTSARTQDCKAVLVKALKQVAALDGESWIGVSSHCALIANNALKASGNG